MISKKIKIIILSIIFSFNLSAAPSSESDRSILLSSSNQSKYAEIFNNNSEFNKKFLDEAEWNKILKERNEKLLKVYTGDDVPTFNTVDDMNAYNEMKDGLKIVKD